MEEISKLKAHGRIDVSSAAATNQLDGSVQGDGHLFSEQFDGSIAAEPFLDVSTGAALNGCIHGGVDSGPTLESSRRVSWGDEAVYEYFITDAERKVKQRAAAPSLLKADAVRADNATVFADSMPQPVSWQQ